MRDCVSTERDQAHNSVGVNPMLSKISLGQPDHTRQVTTRRMPRNKDQFRVTPEFTNIQEGPSHGCRRVFYVFRAFCLWKKPVIGCNNCNTLFSQLLGNGFSARTQPATVKPNDGRKRLSRFWVVKVELASPVRIATFRLSFNIVGNISL